MTTLVLEVLAHDPIDLALAAPRFVLWRRGGHVRMSVDDQHSETVRRALALRGVRTSVVTEAIPTPPMLVRALGMALAPARLQEDDLDIVDVRVVPLAEATARAVRRPFRYWPLGERRRSRCRALLRGSDALLDIRRTAWCSRGTLRANRSALRPVLFDLAATAPAMRVYASDHALTRWIRG
ncbi:MAG: hypothetical protein LC750_01995 [Actinobacteria bacterium]|nr:hypothetical protein [Actinomycetota bacterium]